MVEEYNDTEQDDVQSPPVAQTPSEPPPPDLPAEPRLVASKLINGEVKPEDITVDQEEVIAELDAMLPIVHGGLRGTVQHLAMRMRELMLSEEDEEEDEPA